jgi:ATP-dependent DNA ligase
MILNSITYFYPEKPVLILKDTKAFQEMSDSPLYVAEPKYNGQRCEIHLLDGEIEFWDRHGKLLSYNSNSLYEDGRKEIKKELVRIFGSTGYFVLDSELRHNKVTGIQNKIVIYDIHVYKNEVLNKMVFGDRRALLESLGFSIYNGDTVHLIYQYKDDFETHYNSFIAGNYGDADEFEGLVMKRLDGKLKLGRASGTDSIWMFKVRKQTGRHRY